MRRLIFLVLCLVLVGSVTDSQAITYRNEPPGFRGLRWGTRTNRIKGLKYLQIDEQADKKSIFTFGDVVQVFNSLKSAGFSMNKSIKMLVPIIDLARAEGTSLSITGETVAFIMKTFKLRSNETRRLVDVIAGVISVSKLTMKNLSDAIKVAAKIFARLNYSEQDMLVALAIASEAGVFGFRAGYAWRRILMSLFRPSMLAYKSMVTLKLGLFNTNKKRLPIPVILEQFKWGLKNLATRNMVLKHLVNIFGLESLPVVIKGVVFGIDGWARLEARAIHSPTALEKAQAKKSPTEGRKPSTALPMDRLAIFTGNFPIKAYIRQKNGLKVGTIQAKSIHYIFAYKRLLAVEIQAYGSSNVKALYGYLQKRYGSGNKMPGSMGGGLGWLGYRTIMFLKMNPAEDHAQFVMISPRILKWASTEAKRR